MPRNQRPIKGEAARDSPQISLDLKDQEKKLNYRNFPFNILSIVSDVLHTTSALSSVFLLSRLGSKLPSRG